MITATYNCVCADAYQERVSQHHDDHLDTKALNKYYLALTS